MVIALCGLGYAWYSRRPALPELDWSLGKGVLRLDGIRLGMTKVEAYTAMGETAGQVPEHVYSSADQRTFFIGEKVGEVASFDRILLPDGTELRSGDAVVRLASLWPIRFRPEKDGFTPFSLTVSEGGRWYEGAGGLWVYADKNERLEYFDLCAPGGPSLGGPFSGPPPPSR